jgi:hypothetical protein
VSTVTRETQPGDTGIIQRKIPLAELMILVLSAYWLLSFFGQSIIPGLSHTGGFIYVLAVGIVVLIIVKFLSAGMASTPLFF